MASVSAGVFGNSQRISGPMMRDVFPALKLSEDANEMKTSQAISGR